MEILWNYLRPYRWWIILSMLLAGLAQVMLLYDPVIFGKIIDNYVFNPSGKPENGIGERR
jgi:ATP-binding cassette subfamily B protein